MKNKNSIPGGKENHWIPPDWAELKELEASW
jgi:hypothetical protein